MPNKLDMGQAWNVAVALIGKNRDVILVVAGVFFFLPSLAVALLMPGSEEMMAIPAGAEPDFEQITAQMSALYADVWWVFLLLGLAQAIGVLGLLALLTDTARPTVGEALVFGLKALLPYLAAQILVSLAVVILIVALIALGAAIGVAVAALLGLVGIVLAIYVYVKFSLVSPVIGVEKQLNPFAALARSWRLTKGNSLRLFVFYLLLVIAMIVLSIVVGLVAAGLSLLGEQAGLVIGGIVNGLMNMAFVVVMLAVLVAIHRQLAGRGAEEVGKTFE